VPPGAINWNDADDNNSLHAEQIVMDLDGTISTEAAVLSQGKKEDYDDTFTMGLALVAKDFLKYIIQHKVNNERLKGRAGTEYSMHAFDREGRPVVVRRSAPGGLHHPRLAEPNIATILGLQPGIDPERAGLDGHHPERHDTQAAAEKAFKRVEEIFAKYPIGQA